MRRFLNSLLVCGLALALCGAASAQDEKKDKGKKKADGPEAAFKKMDENGDGKVSKDEFKKWADSNARLKEKPEAADKQWEKMDENKDGNVTLEEFKKFTEAAMKRKKDK